MEFKQWCAEKRAEGRRLAYARKCGDGPRAPAKPDYERLGFVEREDAEGRN